MDSVVYKYFDFDENFKKTLENGYLWFSYPHTFNDPFEFRLQVKKDLRDEEILEFFELYKKHAHNSKEEIGDDFNKVLFMYRQNPDQFIDYFLKPFIAHVDKFGVCCFSKTNKNILMWSHYANKHKGLVLEFKEKLLDKSIYEMNDSINMTVMDQISYSNEFPTIKISSSLLNVSEEIRKVVFTKSKDWKYEQEIRIISPRNGEHLFDRNCLNAVYFGHKFSDENKKEIAFLLNNYFPNQNIKVNEMKINDRTYSLRLNNEA